MKICITRCIRIETYDASLLFKFCFNPERVTDYFESVSIWYMFINPIADGGGGGIFIPHHHSISCHSETT